MPVAARVKSAAPSDLSAAGVVLVFFFVHFAAALHPLLALHDTCVLTFLLSTALILTNPNIEPKKKGQPQVQYNIHSCSMKGKTPTLRPAPLTPASLP